MRVNKDEIKTDIVIKNLDLLTEYISKGMTITEICKNVFKISKAMFYHICAQHPEVREAYYKGLQPAIFDCVDALKRMCEGYYVEEEKILPNGDRIIFKKYIPPNSTAIMFFLKNRDSENWRDRWDVTLEGGIMPVVIKNDLTE